MTVPQRRGSAAGLVLTFPWVKTNFLGKLRFPLPKVSPYLQEVWLFLRKKHFFGNWKHHPEKRTMMFECTGTKMRVHRDGHSLTAINQLMHIIESHEIHVPSWESSGLTVYHYACRIKAKDELSDVQSPSLSAGSLRFITLQTCLRPTWVNVITRHPGCKALHKEECYLREAF